MASPRPSALNVARSSPFQRQPSASPAPNAARATTPTLPAASSGNSLLSGRAGSLSPEKQSPFARRPSQHNPSASSPLNRPSPLVDPRSAANKSPSPIKHETVDLAQSDSRQLRSTFETRATEEHEAMMRPVATTNGNGMSTISSRMTPTTARNPQQNVPSMRSSPLKTSRPITTGAGFQHIPPALLRSMRESFEVLDSSNVGAVDSAAVASMLEQLGQESNSSPLREFFPPDAPRQFNLARYLDTLSSSLSEVSPPDELTAAFEAFDVDDSGQIDVAELRKALLNTVPEPGQHSVRLSERDIDSVLSDFTARRAFGAKGVNVAKSRGEVFRYRDFMANFSGGVGETSAEPVEAL